MKAYFHSARKERNSFDDLKSVWKKAKAKKLKLICRQIYKHKIYLQKSTLLKENFS